MNSKSKVRPKRIAIIGCENVAPASVYSLGLSHAVDEILLVGEGNETLGSDVRGLMRSFPLESPFRILTCEYQWNEQTDIVIVAVGEAKTSAMPVAERLARNAELVRNAVTNLQPYRIRGVVLITTSPVDEMTQVAQETSGLPVQRVIGIGGVSPWLESEARLARKKGQTA